MAQTSSAQKSDPSVNTIEQDVLTVATTNPSGEKWQGDSISQAGVEAVSTKRRREFEDARARLRERASLDEGGALPQPGMPVGVEELATGADTNPEPLNLPPERVRKRYLRAGDQYFLKEAPYQLAFEDLGRYLVTEHNRPDVVESMVDMAYAKSWRRVRVSGHEAFRSEVWLQAMLRGIEVSGYEPKAADLARLSEARGARLSNRIEGVSTVEPAIAVAVTDRASETNVGPTSKTRMQQARARTAPNDAVPPRTASQQNPEVGSSYVGRNATNEGIDAPRGYAGELREHGSAPYQHNPARSDSYYVVFRDTAGADHVVWGVDLKRAVHESHALIGQQVRLEYLGKRHVTVRAPVLDGDGVEIGEEEKDVYRNAWQVTVEHRRPAVSQQTLPARPSAYASEAPAGSRDAAVGTVAHGRRETRSADEERTLHLAVLTAAMREQGFSERSIARVQQRAARLLVALREEGIPIPAPKVFDAMAPSERTRRMRGTDGHGADRDVELAPAKRGSPER